MTDTQTQDQELIENPNPSSTPKRVLIAEDDRLSRRLLEATLKKWGFDVIATTDGREALEAVCQPDAPRLAVLDWMMPEMDGVEVCRRFRERPDAHMTYIILLTAKGGKEDIVAGLEGGADDYVSKPFDQGELQARINCGLRIIRLQESLSERVKELERLNQILKDLSSIDGLTGVPNRRRFDEELEKNWRRALRQAQPLSVIMLDIDKFKGYNDNYGHLAGDDCLKKVAGALHDCVKRGGDMLARYGGEEFVALLGETDNDGALRLAEGLRQAVADLKLPHEFSETAPHVTISLGVATCVPDRDGSPADLLKKADQGLYFAKENGRNQVGQAPEA